MPASTEVAKCAEHVNVTDINGEAVMKWSSDKPQRPGWYWWQRRKGAKLLIVEVELLDGHLGIREQNRVDYLRGSWDGPLEPPR